MIQQCHAERLVLDGYESREQHSPEYKVLLQATLVLYGPVLEPGTVDQSHVALGRTCDNLPCWWHVSLLKKGCFLWFAAH
jgi:hypothetical protein